MAKAEVETECVRTIKLTLSQDEAQVLWDILANVYGTATRPRGEAFYSTLIALEKSLEGWSGELFNTEDRIRGSIEVLDV